MNTPYTEDRTVRRIEGLLGALMVVVILMAPAFAIWSLGAFPPIGVA